MPEESRPYGLLAEFDTPEALMTAARRARKAGYERLDAFTPFPVEGLGDALGIHEGRIGPLGFLGGLMGIGIALAMQYYVNIDYPINVGGRPLFALPAFLVVGFELMILFAVLVPVGGMLVLNRLPKLHHPVFDAPRFGLASDDRYFLCILSDDPWFNEKRTRTFLDTLGARSVEAVPA